MTRPVPRRLLGYFVRLVASALLVWIILSVTDSAEALGRLANVDWHWIVAALVLLTVQNFAMALRWCWIAGSLGVRFPFLWGLKEYYLSNLVNQTLPGGIVGDAARAYRARDVESGAIRDSIHAVMIERFVGQTTVFLLLVCGMIASVTWAQGIAWPVLFPAIILGLFAALIVVGAIAIWGRLPHPVTAFLSSVRKALLSRVERGRQILLACVIAALNVMAFYCCARATGSTLSVEAIATVIPLILTAMLVPVSVGGWGWREGAAAGLFPLLGMAGSAGVAASLAYGIVLLVSSLPGALVVFLPQKGRAEQAREPISLN